MRCFTIALEITPPREAHPAVLLRRANLIGDSAQRVNVVQRAERQSSLDACLALQAHGLNPMLHLVTAGKGAPQLEDELDAAAAAGLRHVLCIRGDREPTGASDAVSVRDAVALAVRRLPGAQVGVGFNQYARNAAALRTLQAKLEAGAGCVQTQPVFDTGLLLPFVARIRACFPGVVLMPMVVPLLSSQSAVSLERRLGFSLPARVHAALAGGAAAGWRLFEETLRALWSEGWADGVAIMTFEMDPPAGTGERIRAALQAAGVPALPASVARPTSAAVPYGSNQQATYGLPSALPIG